MNQKNHHRIREKVFISTDRYIDFSHNLHGMSKIEPDRRACQSGLPEGHFREYREVPLKGKSPQHQSKSDGRLSTGKTVTEHMRLTLFSATKYVQRNHITPRIYKFQGGIQRKGYIGHITEYSLLCTMRADTVLLGNEIWQCMAVLGHCLHDATDRVTHVGSGLSHDEIFETRRTRRN